MRIVVKVYDHKRLFIIGMHVIASPLHKITIDFCHAMITVQKTSPQPPVSLSVFFFRI